MKRHFLTLLILVLGVGLLPRVPVFAWPPQPIYMCDDPLGCYPQAPVRPPSTCGTTHLPATAIPVTISGRITDPEGTGISLACVYWSHGSSLTDTGGYYELTIAAGTAVTIYAYKARYTWNSLYVEQPENAALTSNDMILSFLHWTDSDPLAFHPSTPTLLTFRTRTSAPPDRSRVLVHLPDGSILNLAPSDTGLSPGWTLWTASWNPPMNLAEGAYSYRSCVLRTDALGDCDNPQGIELSYVEPPANQPQFYADATPPKISTIGPPAEHNTVRPQQDISFSALDALSAVAAGSEELYLDGVRVSTSNYYFPSNPLSLGTHEVTASVSDLAGNRATQTWRFNVVTLIPGEASAHLDSRMILVNPTSALPMPDHVTFPNVTLTFGAFPLSLSSNLGAGYGELQRAVSLSNMKVIFDNGVTTEELAISQSRWENPSTSSGYYPIAALAPTDQAISVAFDEIIVPVGDIRMQVPTGYGGSDATATLIMPDASLGEIVPASSGNDPMANEFTGLDPLVVSIGVTNQTKFEDNGTAGASVTSGPEGQVHATIRIPGVVEEHRVFKQEYLAAVGETLNLPPAGNRLATTPLVSCAGTTLENKPYPCLLMEDFLGRPHSWVWIPGTSLGFYGNHWIARDDDTSEYLVWHQISANVGDFPCPNGSGAAVTARLDSFSTAIEQVISGTDLKSAWKFKRTLATQSSFGGAVPDLNFGLVNENYLQLNSSANFDPDLDSSYAASTDNWSSTLPPETLGTTVTWTGAARNTNEMSALTASFIPATTGLTSSIDIHLVDLETYNFTLDPGSC